MGDAGDFRVSAHQLAEPMRYRHCHRRTFAGGTPEMVRAHTLVKKGEIRMVLRMFQDGPRMDIAQHPSSPEDGFKDGN